MLKNTQELKDFILWAAKAKIQAFKVGDVEVQFSNFAFIEEEASLENPLPQATEEKNTSKTLVDTLEPSAEDEELLFWSSKG